MRGVVVAILFITVYTGCTDRTKVPEGILSKDAMRDLVWDLMQVDVYSRQHSGINMRDSLEAYKTKRTVFYQQVLDLHNTSRTAFNKSLDYYMSRPDLTQVIFDTLAARQARSRDLNLRTKRAEDSLRIKQLERTGLVRDSTRKDSIRRDSIRKADVRMLKARRDSLRRKAAIPR